MKSLRRTFGQEKAVKGKMVAELNTVRAYWCCKIFSKTKMPKKDEFKINTSVTNIVDDMKTAVLCLHALTDIPDRLMPSN